MKFIAKIYCLNLAKNSNLVHTEYAQAIKAKTTTYNNVVQRDEIYINFTLRLVDDF